MKQLHRGGGAVNVEGSACEAQTFTTGKDGGEDQTGLIGQADC